jgi:hypothetical protein
VTWTPRQRLVALGMAAAVMLAAVVVIDIVRPDGRPSAPPGSWTMVPHSGLGAWIDVYDWTTEFGGEEPPVGPDDVEAMAEAGIQTMYVQTSRAGSAEDVIEPGRLDDLIDRAHANDMHVVAWYLPTLVDVDRDLRRLVAASDLKVDGIGVDVESTDVVDPIERTRRVVTLSSRLRAELGDDKVLAAITLTAVHLQVVNTDYWPGFPWADIGATYDVIMPMTYWSLRQGELHDGARYVGENIDRIRASVGREDIPIHPVGGIADDATLADIAGMLSAIEDRGAIGGSLYDWNTSSPAQWLALQPLRELRQGPR